MYKIKPIDDRLGGHGVFRNGELIERWYTTPPTPGQIQDLLNGEPLVITIGNEDYSISKTNWGMYNMLRKNGDLWVSKGIGGADTVSHVICSLYRESDGA